jgi:hypothetical protein
MRVNFTFIAALLSCRADATQPVARRVCRVE